MKSNLIQFILISIISTGCASYAYYQSPLQATANTYKPIPMQSDSSKSATYVHGAVSLGGANVYHQDGNINYTAGMHRSHNFGHFQGYCGVRGVLGRYRVDSMHNGATRFFNNQYLDEEIINANAERKFYGAAGAFGAMNYVIAKKSSEWRVIGAELAWDKEFGRYLDFRKSLQDTSANIIERRNNYLTLALATDFVFSSPNGSVGFKIAIVNSLRNLRGYDKNGMPMKLSPGYLSNTLHFQGKRLNASVQWNSGTYALTFMVGGAYNLSKLRDQR